jgi:hypothetical protein
MRLKRRRFVAGREALRDRANQFYRHVPALAGGAGFAENTRCERDVASVGVASMNASTVVHRSNSCKCANRIRTGRAT